MSKKNIVILGSTGSIGASALDVIRHFKEKFRVVGLAVGANIGKLRDQVREFSPDAVAVADQDKAREWEKGRLAGVKVFAGREGVCRLAALKNADLVLVAIVGSEAVFPVLSAIRAKKTIALANKESIVAAGPIIRREARKRGVAIIPIDSEQNAVFQCLQGTGPGAVENIYLTASGGPLWDCPAREIPRASLKKVMAHPRWQMGKKITVDSATLMNKGLEVLEAQQLFGLELKQIKVLVHRQALVHSMVEFIDGSILAQMAVTDMRLPIQVALSYPERWPNARMRLDPYTLKELSFAKPDMVRFPCLGLAYEAGRRGGTAPCALNAANEVAVAAFLEKRIAFGHIPRVIEKVLKSTATGGGEATLEDIFETDTTARMRARRLVDFYARKDARKSLCQYSF